MTRERKTELFRYAARRFMTWEEWLASLTFTQEEVDFITNHTPNWPIFYTKNYH